MSNIVKLSSKDFDSQGNLTSHKNHNMVVLFYADYCPACRSFKPTFLEVAQQMKNNKNVMFAMVHTPDNRDLMSRMDNFPFEVMYIPTLVSYHNGKFFSTYDYDQNDPKDRATYRTKPDLMEYVNGIGTAKINFK